MPVRGAEVQMPSEEARCGGVAWHVNKGEPAETDESQDEGHVPRWLPNLLPVVEGEVVGAAGFQLQNCSAPRRVGARTPTRRSPGR